MAYDNNANFRLRIARDVFRLLFVPPLALFIVVHVSHVRLGWWTPAAYILSIVLAAIGRVQYIDLVQRREAKQFGARLIPKVVGKWPGNIDVLLKLKKGLTNGYIYQAYLELFEEYQCTTLNTRFLWMDNVSSLALFHVIGSSWERLDHFNGPRALQICPRNWLQPFLARYSAKRTTVSLMVPIRTYGFTFSSESFLGDGIFNRDDEVRATTRLKRSHMH